MKLIKTSQWLAVAGGALATVVAQASPPRSYVSPYPGEYTYADVVASSPVYREVRINEPRQECWTQPVTYREREPASNVRSGDGGAILGGILGAVAGYQFGGGKGKALTTATGALIGAGIGQNHALRHSGPVVERTVDEQQCRTVDSFRTEERVDGYDVTYRYGGQIYHTRMPYDPGNRLRVNVQVSPQVSY